MKSIYVIIPAYNEEKAIQNVINDIPTNIGIKEIIVVNNASTDNTAEVARNNGATVVDQPIPGYGNACLKGIAYLRQLQMPPEIVVFLDGDYSDYPQEMEQLVKPILEDDVDLVIGSRNIGIRQKGAMTPQQIFGNWLATNLINWLYGYNFTDLGPFRAIKWDKLTLLDMQDKTYGWTCEMQVKAAKAKLICKEIHVSYRKRIGFSKISGTIKGTILAGYKILFTIFKNIKIDFIKRRPML